MGKQKAKRPAASRAKNHKTAARSRSARPAARKATKPKTDPSPAVTQQQQRSGKRQPRHASKQAQIIAMLQAPHGATIAAMSHATGWQPHSVRGFLAGVVRKKLGLDLASSAAEGGRVYRIADRQIADRPGANIDTTPASEPA